MALNIFSRIEFARGEDCQTFDLCCESGMIFIESGSYFSRFRIRIRILNEFLLTFLT
jgi:hypothetical protein